jgi:hypothetical protein
MKLAWLVSIGVIAASAQNPLARPDAYVGVFEGQGVALELKGAQGRYTGTLTVQGTSFAATVTADAGGATGTFTVNGTAYRFTLSPLADGFKLESDGGEYRLVRRGAVAAAVPATATPTAAAAPAGIVGTWRNSQGYAKFNADGTGEIDGNPGRYEIQGNQLTMIGAQGRVTVSFTLDGERLSLGANGAAIVLEREKARAPGTAGVRPELVGKWCWMTQTNVQQGARQSNRCLTLDANGTYLFEGLTDSYGPNGGATGESRDTGTWEATDNTLTGRSRSGRVVTYRLEKRNHPKNTSDPMIVLDGQPFVTFYRKAPW